MHGWQTEDDDDDDDDDDDEDGHNAGEHRPSKRRANKVAHESDSNDFIDDDDARHASKKQRVTLNDLIDEVDRDVARVSANIAIAQAEVIDDTLEPQMANTDRRLSKGCGDLVLSEAEESDD